MALMLDPQPLLDWTGWTPTTERLPQEGRPVQIRYRGGRGGREMEHPVQEHRAVYWSTGWTTPGGDAVLDTVAFSVLAWRYV